MANKPKRRRDDARISHRASATPWYLQARYAFPVIAAVILLIGIGVGTTIGLWLAPESARSPTASVPLPISPQDSAAVPEGSPLPVTTHDSESAMRVYEESLRSQPEANRPDPNSAPPIPAPKVALPTPESTSTALPGEEPPQNPPPLAPERWLAFAAPSDPGSDRPKIAIVFDDLGIDQVRSRRAISLPPPLTFALLPYGYNLRDMAQSARARGHEIMVHVPMAPVDLSVDPGPNALQKELGPAEILRRLDWDLSQFEGFIGINNHMGSRFTADREGMRLVMGELKRRGLVFMDSVTSRETKGFHLAAELGVPYAVRDVFLDHDINHEAIRGQLRRVEETARRQGHAIAIGHPHDETLAVVSEWLKTVEARGFDLVPLSAIIRQRMAAGQ